MKNSTVKVREETRYRPSEVIFRIENLTELTVIVDQEVLEVRVYTTLDSPPLMRFPLQESWAKVGDTSFEVKARK